MMLIRNNRVGEMINQSIERENIDFIYPQIEAILMQQRSGALVPTGDEQTKEQINVLIQQLVGNYVPAQGFPQTADGRPIAVTGRYDTEYNQNSVLSLRFEVFEMPMPAANGSTFLQALNVDLNDGEVWDFYQLFQVNSDYRIRIRNYIKEQIRKNDIPTLGDVPAITDDQGYYLTENNLVVFFPELLFTPHVVGPPEFAIPYELIAPIASKNGPICRIIDC